MPSIAEQKTGKTIAERVAELQKQAATKRAEEGRAKPTDDLVLRPDDFTKTEAAQIRATEKSKQPGGYSYLNPDSRGQQLSNDSFEATYGKSAYDNLYGVGYAGPADGSEAYRDKVTAQTGQQPDYTKQYGVFQSGPPKRGKDEDSNSYRLRYLTWERNEARSAFNQTVEITKGVRNYTDVQQNQIRRSEAEQKARGGQTRVNPTYSRLSNAEKVLNQQYYEKTGQYLVNPTIDTSSGRAPIRTGPMSTAEKKAQASFNAKMSRLQTQIDRGEIDAPTESMFTKEEIPFLDDYLNYQESQNAKKLQGGRDEEGQNQLGDQLSEIKRELGITDGQEIAFDADGTPYIVEDGEKVDPKARAEEKLRRRKNEDIQSYKEEYETEKARIMDANRINGVISQQGARQLDKLEREYQKNLRNLEEDWDDKIEDELKYEESRQDQIDARIENLLSPETAIREAEQKAIMREARGLFNSGAVTNWTAAISQAKSMMTADSKNPTKADQFKSADRKIFTPGFDRSQAFSTAATVLGYDAKTIDEYLSSRGFTKKDIASQRADYQKSVLGYTQEEIDAENDDMSVQDILKKDPSELSDEELDFLQEYEIENPKKAARWKMKILNPGMTDAEIWNAVEAEFEKEKPKTIANAKNELFNSKVQEYLDAGKPEEEAYRLANLDVSRTFSTAKAKSSGDDEKDSDSIYSQARDSLETALGDGLITPRQAGSYLREYFPKLKSSQADEIEKSFVRYNSSSQSYESLVSPHYKALKGIKDPESKTHLGKEFGDLTPVEQLEIIKYNEDALDNGQFIDGVYYTNDEIRSQGLTPDKPINKAEKKEEKKSSISDDDFGDLWEEALKEE